MHDSHVHLNLSPLDKNLSEVISNFVSCNGKHILTQTTDLIDVDSTMNIAQQYPEVIDVAMGLHPTCFEEYTIQKGKTKSIYEFCQKYLTDWEELFEKEKFKIKAIGETGLDYYQFNLNQQLSSDQKEMFHEIQKMAFSRQVYLAKACNLPMSIHARDQINGNQTVQDALRILVEEGKGQIRGCFHSYTGDIAFLNDILDLGFYIGFNAIITYKSGENVRQILRKVPPERILFETDGPFLPPQSVRKNKNIKEKFAQPADVREILEVAAQIKSMDPEKLENITDENYQILFH